MNLGTDQNLRFLIFDLRAGGWIGDGVEIINCLSKVTFGYICRELMDGRFRDAEKDQRHLPPGPLRQFQWLRGNWQRGRPARHLLVGESGSASSTATIIS